MTGDSQQAAATRADRAPSYGRIDLANKSFDERYKLLNGAVIPRPIALVSTLDENGDISAAPFSSFMIASVEEGLLAFSVGPSDRPKATLRNIRRNGEYVINTVPEALAREVQMCGQSGAHGARRFELAGLSGVASERISTPRVAETKIQFECTLRKILTFGQSHMVVGAIVLMHAREGIVRDGKIDPLNYGPLGRIAGRNYCSVRDIFSV
jgi:flavin reductase (DIM6/NTAB) family NADH-FMN oxidoreductase RutF